MEKLAFINAHLLDPTQKISKVGTILVENKKISGITNNNQKITDENFKVIDWLPHKKIRNKTS